ncbi:MAG: polyprenyl synthetase family protein, partial [Clostridia bacterium]|nr:polyprenyl synthetase family protein [Clostridia bacterium]
VEAFAATLLVLAAGQMLGADFKRLISFAAAVEMIHASSLIHDDLPCMDNDTMRRGKPCNHIVFGEANALYAGLGLLNLAYEMLLENADTVTIKAIYTLCNAAGTSGIMKGQSLDIFYEGKEQSLEVLKEIHDCKTGKLITASCVIPAILTKQDKKILNALQVFGENIGTAFQIVDDILDVTSSSEELGKTAGKDLTANKLTYAKLFGVEGAAVKAEEHIETAVNSLKNLNMDCGFLEDTAKYIINRRN